MPIKILQTRLSIPSLRPDFVPRTRLINQLNSGLAGRLTLVIAPAGFGKTTLILEWLKQLPTPGYSWDRSRCAWISLDPADNQPKQFFAYLLEALQRINPGFCADLSASLESAFDTDLIILIQDLINEFVTSKDPFLIVFDDYHVITADGIHELVNLLVDYMPENTHLVITSRDTPPLDLPRWRVRGQVNEIASSELRFTHEEIQAFLADTMRLDIPVDILKTLESSTEGWAAGLQLAALSLRSQSGQDKDQYEKWSQRFTGTDRAVADYLLVEVLEQQPQEIQDFILSTSILPQFNSSLCDHLLLAIDETRTGNLSGDVSAQHTLEFLEKSDLFLTPLDNQRHWYRYHHLFADFLQNRLKQSWPQEKINTLHLAASNWFRDEGMTHEAVVQAFKAGAEETAAEIIEAIPMHHLWRPDLSSMVPTWYQQLSPTTLDNYPGVLLQAAGAQLILGQISDFRQLLDRLKQMAVFEAERIIFEAVLMRNDGLLDEAAGMLKNAVEELSVSSEAVGDFALLQLAVCNFQLGDLDEAERHVTIIRSKYEDSPASNQELFPIHLQAIQIHGDLTFMRGNLNRAQAIYQAGLDWIAISDELNPMSGLFFSHLGAIHYEWNEIQTAQDYYDRAMIWGERTRITDILFGALFGLADLACYYQEPKELQNIFDQFNTYVRDAKIPGMEIRVAWISAGYWLRMGHLERIIRWMNASGLPMQDPPPYPLHEGYQTLIAGRIAESYAFKTHEHLPEMLELVEGMLPQAEAVQNRRHVIRNLLLKALLLERLSRSREAMRTLYNALELGKAGGFLRVYLDTGPRLHELLEKSLSYGEHITDIRRLLIAFAKETSHKPEPTLEIDHARTIHGAAKDRDKIEPLVEPLTERESDVLQLIASGLSNKDIQEQLFISNNTVRTHIKNLYGKLGVNNRTQAVLRAQELRLA